MLKNIAVIGSTGSIGVQALDIVRQHPDRFRVEVLTARNNVDLLIRQAEEFCPRIVVISEEAHYEKLAFVLSSLPIKVLKGYRVLEEVVQLDSVDIVLNALVGYAGLLPTIRTLEAGKPLALANKESLVVAGEYVMKLSKQYDAPVYPVDSEHSAIFQCLTGESKDSVKKLILTASGGPFRGKTKEFLKTVTKEQALKHPNWSMGAKITVDSATLMNKGLEVIEANRLFGIDTADIEVVIHPQSIIHSAVRFKDGSVKAQLGLPDMRIPIQYALSYPDRIESNFPEFNFTDYPQLTFEKPDPDAFPSLSLAYSALEKGGNSPCVLNAANEVAVSLFLQDRLEFCRISELVGTCLDKMPYIAVPSYEEYVITDQETRIKAIELIGISPHGHTY